jgi:hypothetical protein
MYQIVLKQYNKEVLSYRNIGCESSLNCRDLLRALYTTISEKSRYEGLKNIEIGESAAEFLSILPIYGERSTTMLFCTQ